MTPSAEPHEGIYTFMDCDGRTPEGDCLYSFFPSKCDETRNKKECEEGYQ